MTQLSKFLSIVMLAVLLVACGGQAAEPEPTAVPPTDVPAVSEATEVEPTDEPTPEPTEVPTEVPTAVPAEVTEPAEEEVIEAVILEEPTENYTDGCVEEYVEGFDYFPEKAFVTDADGFAIDYFSNYKVVTVNTPFTGGDPIQYVLVQCGTPAPEGVDGTVVEVPIQRFVSMSTTYLPSLDALGVLDTIVGVDTGLYASNQNIVNGVADGAIAEIGSGPEVNIEVALDIEPDVIMTFASGFADYDTHPNLEEAGLTAVLNADYLDTTPLGRAEWIDFIAAFYNLEADSEAIYGEIASEYDSLKSLTADIEDRPTVFANSPFDGTWYMPGGNSFTGIQIADAGGDFVWAEDTSGSTLYLDFETVIDEAVDAEYWINVGYFPTLDDMLAADERFGEFAAFNDGGIYNNDLGTTEQGNLPFFEDGVLYANDVLADLIAIFHPDLLPDHEFIFYRPME